MPHPEINHTVSGAQRKVKDLESSHFWETRYVTNPDLGCGVGSKGVWKRQKLDMLSELCRRHRIRKILDLACGDLQVLRDLPSLDRYDYVGIDSSERVIQQNQARFPNLKFIRADLCDIRDLGLDIPDLVICFDALFHIQHDATYEKVIDFMFNCGAKAVALTCTVEREDTNGINLWCRDFRKHTDKMQLGYVHKIERPFRLPFERIIAFDLCEPSVHAEPTEVVYVCSPDREEQLAVSLSTLLGSGRPFDRVVIFCVGQMPPHWQFSDSRIVVKQVPPLFDEYFYGNKIYLCTRMASRVIFLDTDTVILRPLDLLWHGRDADLLARIGGAYGLSDWDSQLWRDTFRRVGASEVPMFNAGVLVFQNHAHHRIHADWLGCVTRYLAGELLPPFRDPRMAEQWALALAVGLANLRYTLLEPFEHSYAWRGDPHSEAVVFHTGSALFDKCFGEPDLQSVPLPLAGLQERDSARIDAGLQEAIESVNSKLHDYDVKNELARLQRLESSSAMAAGNLLVSLVKIASAISRLDLASVSEHSRIFLRSIRRLTGRRESHA